MTQVTMRAHRRSCELCQEAHRAARLRSAARAAQWALVVIALAIIAAGSWYLSGQVTP